MKTGFEESLPCTFVIFGATGNLASNKLLPALYHLEAAARLSESLSIVAFSRREARRCYVQDVIEADGARVWRLLSARDAHVLVCGDARMADAVRDRLIDVAMREGRLSPGDAHDMIAAMRADGRYVEDVWGVHLNRPAALKKIADERYSQGVRWLDRMKRSLLPLRERSAAQRLI